FFDAKQFSGAGELAIEFFGVAFVELAEPVGRGRRRRRRELGRRVETAGGGKAVDRGERGAGEDHAAEFAERGGDRGGGIEAGERELAVAGRPPERGQIRGGKLFVEDGNLPEGFGGERGDFGVVDG